ncbi:MAG: MbcA/ParS/Xre antitoxin family protein [Nitrospinales bacterium]
MPVTITEKPGLREVSDKPIEQPGIPNQATYAPNSLIPFSLFWHERRPLFATHTSNLSIPFPKEVTPPPDESFFSSSFRQSEGQKAKDLDRFAGCVQVFGALLDKWALTKKEGTLLLGYEDEKDTSDFLLGLKKLQTRDAKDRVRYLFKIHSALHRLFEDTQVEKDWLREPNDEYLDGKSPLDILKEGSMENLLLVKQFVERISGR